MPNTLTLENILDAVYERLKASAKRHRRSLSTEAIACLESALLAERMSATERVARAMLHGPHCPVVYSARFPQ